ncbi:citryl-CoA lyase [Streptomyces sp. DR7-3]|uniref:citryl-CoA lyase n=1 Tax=Streptomyces malaysiensis TaxID=92644 RepID=UPI0020448633|nr:citryl-CoA lyase [Streptomyces sp. DR7-3]MCM3806787.1 citryl-CoA lyase [Streptomyces sp. DR7-3]
MSTQHTRRPGEDTTASPDARASSDWWSTAISRIRPGEILLRGYPVEELIGRIGFAEQIWLLLRGELPTPGQARLLEAALVAAVDHGPQAPSIAAARMAATCGIGLNSAMATGAGLLGDTHGGAGQQCMQLLERIIEGESAASIVAEHRARRAYVPGFGHRFHPRDPRRDPLLALVRQAIQEGEVQGDALAAGLALEEALASDRPKPVPMNIDGATAIIYAELGFPAELGRGLFVLSRSVGILAHAWEEQQSGTRIKGPLPRPLLPGYHGPPPRAVPPRPTRDNRDQRPS